MHTKTITLGLAIAAAFLTSPALAQAPAAMSDPAFMAGTAASQYFKRLFTKAAEQMSAEDYAFKPTPEVRSFGEILAHIASNEYAFCSAAKGEVLPSRPAATGRTEIQAALAQALAYCDSAYAGMTPEKLKSTIKWQGREMPVMAVLIYRTHHSALHYGNIITYMRLRGKVPPSTAELGG
jgi:uncharacterized damage-inducible protein DinB